MTHHPNLAGQFDVIRMHTTLQRTYYWPKMAADVTFTFRDFVHCVKYRVCLRKRIISLKFSLAFEPL